MLPDQQRVLGPDHPAVLTTRNNIAYWTSESGDAVGALQLLEQLLPDLQLLLGPDHPDVLATRSDQARLLVRTGRVDDARDIYQRLLRDQSACWDPIIQALT